MSALRQRVRLAGVVALTALLFGAVAQARTTAIDDSATLPYDAPLVLHWEQLTPHRPVNNRMTGTLTVHVRLNVASWLKRSGRIYLVLPAQQPGGMSASWVTQGRLLPGHLTTGNRTLVYSGPITTPFIEDVLQLTVQVDSAQLQQLYHVNFGFEMDEP
jgi:hypothetical protein